MRPPRRVSPIELLRLSAALGPGVDRVFLGGLLFAIAIVAGLFLMFSPVTFDIAPPEPTSGRVAEVLYTQGRRSGPHAVVWIGARRVFVRLPNALACHVGDRIELVRHKVLLGVRYTAGRRVCGRA